MHLHLYHTVCFFLNFLMGDDSSDDFMLVTDWKLFDQLELFS